MTYKIKSINSQSKNYIFNEHKLTNQEHRKSIDTINSITGEINLKQKNEHQTNFYNPTLEKLSHDIKPEIVPESNTNQSQKTTTNIEEIYDIKDKKDQVGIMYSIWFNAIGKNGNNIPNIISETNNPKDGIYYSWGRPEGGFYNSSNEETIEKHMKLLSDANVDFIIIDLTNMADPNPNSQFWKTNVTDSLGPILDKMVEMRKEGKKTPYVVNWVWTGNDASNGNIKFENWKSVDTLYEQYYTNEKYKDLWVYWDGKPFIMTTSEPQSLPSKNITTRSMWGLNGVDKVDWSYLELDNDKPGIDDNGKVEQIGVSTAIQQTYMSHTNGPDASIGRRDGKTFYEQWKNAFKYHPKIVTITWWNEWCALNLGNGTYTDLYNQEYSRDIEPMEGGHEDAYYQMMKQYIAAYKAGEPCPYLPSNFPKA